MQPSSPQPTRLRQAIDRAIARLQAEQAMAANPQPPQPPRPIAGETRIVPQPAAGAATEMSDQAQPDEINSPAPDSSSAQDDQTTPEQFTELNAPDETTQTPATAEYHEEHWPIPPQIPAEPPRKRNRHYAKAVKRAQARDRSVYAQVERQLTPVQASELGWHRPQLRRPVNQPAAAPESAEPAAVEIAEQRLEPVQAAPQVVPAAPATRPRKPLKPDVLAAISPDVAPPPELRRPPLYYAVLAGITWAAVVAWMLFGTLGPQTTTPVRLLYGVSTLGLGLLTWAPIQWGLRLQALTWRGTVGWMIILWCLAFVRPPQASLTSLPDTPLYLLFCTGVFLAISAAAMPMLYLRRIRHGKSRRERFDVRRVQRQANETGIFAAVCILLAAMNVLEVVSVLLLIAILGLSEMLLLSLQRS